MKRSTVNLTPNAGKPWRKFITIGSVIIQLSWARDFWITRLKSGLVERHHFCFNTTYCPKRNHRHYSLVVGRLAAKVAFITRQPDVVICDDE